MVSNVLRACGFTSSWRGSSSQATEGCGRRRSVLAFVFLLCCCVVLLLAGRMRVNTSDASVVASKRGSQLHQEADDRQRTSGTTLKMPSSDADLGVAPDALSGHSDAGGAVGHHHTNVARRWDWVRIESAVPIPHYIWAPRPLVDALQAGGSSGAPLGDKDLRGGWGVLVYLHGAGEAGDDLNAIVKKRGAMGTPPQIIEGKCLRRSSSSGWARENGGAAREQYSEMDDGASAQPDTHPLRNGSVAASRMLIVAPQSLYGWPHDPTAMATLAAWIESWMSTASLRVSPAPSGSSGTSPRLVVAADAVPIDANRIVVTGASQGGFAVLELAARGVGALFVSICGFSTRDAFIARGIAQRVASRANKAEVHAPRQTPYLFLVHGRNDEFVPHDASDRLVDAISLELNGNKPQSRTSLSSISRIVVPSGKELSQVLNHEHLGRRLSGEDATGQTMPDIVFADMATTRDPLDIMYSGHAAWRDAFAASSPIWGWLRSA